MNGICTEKCSETRPLSECYPERCYAVTFSPHKLAKENNRKKKRDSGWGMLRTKAEVGGGGLRATNSTTLFQKRATHGIPFFASINLSLFFFEEKSLVEGS